MRELRPEEFTNLPEFPEQSERLLDAASDEVLTAAVEAHVMTNFGIDDYFRQRLGNMLAQKYEITFEEALELFDARAETRREEIRIKGYRYSRHDQT